MRLGFQKFGKELVDDGVGLEPKLPEEQTLVQFDNSLKVCLYILYSRFEVWVRWAIYLKMTRMLARL